MEELRGEWWSDDLSCGVGVRALGPPMFPPCAWSGIRHCASPERPGITHCASPGVATLCVV